jgi:hypothetical protein
MTLITQNKTARGFRGCDWAQLCQKLGWHYDIRAANNTFVTLKVI